MGLHSEIGIKFTCHNEVSAIYALNVLNEELRKCFKEKKEDNYISRIFSKIIIEDKYITLYEGWTKWYENDPLVKTINSFIRCHTKNSASSSDDTKDKEELFVGCNFMSINEYDKIKYLVFGEPEKYIGVNLTLDY